MTEALYVGVDVGTTAVKAGIVDGDGRERTSGWAPLRWERAGPWTQIHPDDLSEAAFGAIARAFEGGPAGTVHGLGVTSMAETGVLVDAGGDPLAPAIAWHDPRGAEEMAEVADALGEGRFPATTGLEPRPLCTAAKYRWLRRNEPATDRARRWLSVAEWVVHRLGGEPFAELSLASRTGWLDIHGARWWPEALDAGGVEAGILGDLAVAGTAAGRATSGPERVRGAVLTVAGHDHLCGAVGVGAVDDGDVFDSCGTAEAFIAPLPPPVDPGDVRKLVGAGVNVGRHVIDGRLGVLAAQRAGLHLRRFLDLLGVDVAADDGLDEAAVALPPGAEGVRVVDFGAPRAALVDIPVGATPAHVWLAAVEAMTEVSGTLAGEVSRAIGETRRLVVGGGWARSAAVRRAKADRLGPFDYPAVREPGVRGAALLAGFAAGAYSDVASLPTVPSTEEGS